MTMLSAAQLLQRFDVFGRYREVELGGKVWSMRSHLEIMATELKADPTQRDGPADLVAVMMNPGGSRPLCELDAQGWAPALPDRTQYQLMRLAQAGQQHGLKIRHIRVINLSDLRTPKSAELMRALTELAPLGVRGSIHSIFGACRRNELAAALGPTDVPVLRAWGLGSWLAPLARQAVAARPFRGVQRVAWQLRTGSWAATSMYPDSRQSRGTTPTTRPTAPAAFARRS